MPVHATTTVSLRWLESTLISALARILVLALALVVCATVSLASPSPPTGATRQIAPVAVVYAASCTAAGTWYLQGGYSVNYVNAFYTLDLTVPWNTTQPPWIQLPTPTNFSTTTTTCIVSINGTYPFQGHNDTVMSFFGNEDDSQPFMYLYDVSLQTWLQNTSTVTVPTRNHDQAPVGNPIDGKVYVRGGYRSQNASTMDVYDPRTNSFSSLSLPVSTLSNGSRSTGAAAVPVAQGYASTWCSQRSSILYFGGRFGSATAFVSTSIFEYIPANNTWAALSTTGKGPTEREDACIATDQTCSKLVVFGGQDSETIFSDIYILELATMQWTVGPSPSNGRVGMSCTMYDDGFLSWGGASDVFLTTLHGSSPALFNVTTMKWSTRYRMTDSDSPLPSPTNGSGNGGATLALVLGLSMGAIGLAALTAGMLLYRRERKKAAKHYGRIHGRDKDPTEGSSLHGKVENTDSLPPVEQRTEVVKRSENSGALTREPDSQTREQGQRRWQQSLGHKVELCSSTGYDGVAAEMDIVSQNKQEDPTFLLRSLAPMGPMPAICPPASISTAVPLGKQKSSSTVAPLNRSAAAAPSAPTAKDIANSIGEAEAHSSIVRTTKTHLPSPYNPDFL
ncbi:hypothetical protein EMPS_02620 [Entomortierella parvispora]|uniref:Galactose oxidase n=1 Tax=Entomortierella parvispora TaxID=205924 RepID=A0A9P3LTN6_9FUNG|nr:hypothetical protein EMPS_02620 [Entomortierella parvispora]